MKTILKVFSVDIFAKVVTVITTIILIRYMTEYNYAEYTIFIAASNLFNQIAIGAFGKMYIVNYDVFRGKESTLLAVELFLALLVSGVFWIIQPVVRTHFGVLIFLIVSTCVFGYARTVYQQQCKFKIYSLLEMLRVGTLLFFVCFLHWKTKSEMDATLIIFFQSLSFIMVIPFLFNNKSGIAWKKRLEYIEVIKFLVKVEQIYIFIYAALIAILMQIDVLSLKTWSTDYYVSAYSSALKYYNIMLMLLNTVNSVLLPKVTAEDDYKKIRKIYYQQDMLAVVLFIVILVAVIIAPIILPIIDGGKYPDSIVVFRILCFSAFVSFIGSPYNSVLIKEKKYVNICTRIVISILIAIVGNYIFIPISGIKGTAWVTLIAYGFFNLSSRVYAKGIINRKIRSVNT